MEEFLSSQEFYELMQDYRNAPFIEQDKVVRAFEAVKTAIQVQAKVSDDFCGHCMYLSLTEEEQTDKKEDHFCRLFHKRVLHFDKHPLLPRLDECMSIGKPSKNSR